MVKTVGMISNFFYKPVAIETLACFRIVVGMFAMIQLIILLPDWMWFYGKDGIVPWVISDALPIMSTPSVSILAKFLSSLGISADVTVYILTTAYFLSLIGLIAGYKTRFMAVLTWLIHLILNTTGHFTAYGVETFTHIALFYCMVLPVGVCWSLDAYKKPLAIPAHLVTLAVRIIQIHLCIMYMASGIEKAMGLQWWNGEAIWIAMQQDQFHQVDINWMAQIPIVPKMLCWGTLIVETLYPFGMLWQKTKKIWLVAIISMHFFIAIFLGLYLFGTLMMLLNISAFGGRVRKTESPEDRKKERMLIYKL